jgi:hypothetical protein
MIKALSLGLSLLLAPVALAAQPATPAESEAPAFPKPTVLDWGEDFRLNSLPKNAAQAGLTDATAADMSRPQGTTTTRTSPSVAALGGRNPTRTPASNRPIVPDQTMLTVQAPVSSGPVSVGAAYGRYRATPTTRQVSSQDARVSLGIAF